MKQNTQNGKYITIMHTRFLYKIKQEHVKHKHYIQLYKTETKQYKKCDKRKSHIGNNPHMIYISFKNDRQLVIKTFTPLHYTCRHFTFSHLTL